MFSNSNLNDGGVTSKIDKKSCFTMCKRCQIHYTFDRKQSDVLQFSIHSHSFRIFTAIYDCICTIPTGLLNFCFLSNILIGFVSFISISGSTTFMTITQYILLFKLYGILDFALIMTLVLSDDEIVRHLHDAT